MLAQNAKLTLLAIPLILSGCLSSVQEAQVGGAAIGAGTGFVAGKIFDLDDGWLAAATVAGAAAGTLIATNAQTNECAYADGNGGYTTQAC